MKLDEEYKKILLDKYRNEFFETDGINIKELDQIINDDDLRNIIGLNNIEMGELINQNPIDKERLKKLFIANVNYYRLARKRELSIPGTSFLMAIASVVDYKTDKLYAELTVGSYKSIFRR